MAVLLETSIGDLVIDLKVKEAPTACENFVKLCKIKFFNNCLFHTVQKDFIAQAGDPTNTGKTGTSIFGKLPGAKKKYFDDEILPTLKHTVKGTVGMANVRPNENGSHFYITLRPTVEHLDGKHTIFGVIGEGLEVLDKMNSTMTDENGMPFQNIRIWHTEILEDPFDDPDGLEKLIPPKSPEVIKDDEFKKIEDAEDEAELQEKMATTLAKSQATTLELLHDLPDADITPPDNDLFIYKLNPITQDGDLELIFSRFGPIKSCEIVRDWKTGDSLQYGFITFENTRDCENAYMKMHDCVIDDRRIGVNFSQSVSKMWNKFKRGSRMSKDDLDDSEAKGGKGKGGKGGKGKGGSKGKGGKGKEGDVGPPLRMHKEEKPRGGLQSTSDSVAAESKAPRDGGRGDRDRRGDDPRSGRSGADRGRDREREREQERDRRPRSRSRSRGDRRKSRSRSRDRRKGRRRD